MTNAKKATARYANRHEVGKGLGELVRKAKPLHPSMWNLSLDDESVAELNAKLRSDPKSFVAKIPGVKENMDAVTVCEIPHFFRSTLGESMCVAIEVLSDLFKSTFGLPLLQEIKAQRIAVPKRSVLRQLFDEMDRNGDGNISKQECLISLAKSQVLRNMVTEFPRLKLLMQPRRWRKEFDKMDTDGDGAIIFDEFCKFFSAKMDEAGRLEQGTINEKLLPPQQQSLSSDAMVNFMKYHEKRYIKREFLGRDG